MSNDPLRLVTLSSAELPRRVRTALEQLLWLVWDEYSPALERLLAEMDDELLRLAQHARDPTLKSGYADTRARLRHRGADLATGFRTGLENALSQIRQPGPGGAAPQPVLAAALPVDTGHLRLVDEHELDEQAELRQLAIRHEARASLPLMLLGQRFGVLAGAPAFDAERLPVGPQGLYRILATAAHSLDLSLDARLLLYRLFDRQLTLGYEAVLAAMNKLLIGQNVLPGLSYVPLRTRPGGAARAPDGPGGAGAGTHPRRGTVSRADAAAASPRAFTGWPGVADSDPAGGDDHQMFEVLQDLLTERRGLADKLRARNIGPTPPLSLSTDEVVAALAGLQLQPRASHAPRSVPDIRQTLLAQSRQQRGQAAAISREDGDTFELLTLLYTAISRELRDDAPGNALLERLQLPLLRLAMHDRGFFARSQHPARQLLNTIAESAARWSSDEEIDPQLQLQLHHVVEHVVQNYSGDVTVFEHANRSLQEHLQKMVRKAEVSERRQIDAARGKDKLDLAKRRALEVIDAAVLDQHVPRFLRTLLSQVWADVLTLVLLRHGADSEQWRQHERATRHIVQTSLGKAPAPSGLAGLVENALGLVGYQGDEAAAICRHLISSDDPEQDDAASRTELAMQLKSRARLGPDDLLDRPTPTARSAPEQACYEQLRALPFGSWIEFVTNQQGDVVRRRLAWFSPATDRALFVNQRGQRVEEQTLDHVARLLASGQARIVTPETARLVDHAWASALGSLRNLAGEPTPGDES